MSKQRERHDYRLGETCVYDVSIFIQGNFESEVIIKYPTCRNDVNEKCEFASNFDEQIVQ